MVFSAVSSAPQREFVCFEDTGTFRTSLGQGDRRGGSPAGKYDSYELIDHGAPNHGIAPMYQVYQRAPYNGGYSQVVETCDPYENPQRVTVPNSW